MDIIIKNLKIKAEVANTFEKRTKGLMFEKKRKNMLFMYSKEELRSFWMLFVNYPLRICFAGKDKKIIQIEKAVPITTDPRTWKSYKSKKPYKYVLETPFDYKIKIGDELKFQ